MNRELYFTTTSCINPFANLAMEEAMLQAVKPGQIIFFLWQNQNTVVIGRNQNPWKECRLDLLEEEGGTLARRITGGGAVFHDLGNLNFSWIVSRSHYQLEKQLEVILQALRSLGVPAVFSGRNDLAFGEGAGSFSGAKFSGNAFSFTETGGLHHGTLLVDVDMSKLGRYLVPSVLKMQSKGIESVRSRVANLREVVPSITFDELKASLCACFAQVYGQVPLQVSPEALYSAANFDTILEKQRNWDWRFGSTPQFDIAWETKFSWGELSLNLTLREARLECVQVYSDATDVEFIAALECCLKGVEFGPSVSKTVMGLGGKGEEVGIWLQSLI